MYRVIALLMSRTWQVFQPERVGRGACFDFRRGRRVAPVILLRVRHLVVVAVDERDAEAQALRVRRGALHGAWVPGHDDRVSVVRNL